MPAGHSSASLIKAVSLVTLVVQNSALMLMMRYSRVMAGPRYYTSTAVLLAEIFKLFLSWAIYVREAGIRHFLVHWKDDLMSGDTLRMAIPALLYTIQNNLQYIAMSGLDAATAQVTYQLKILTTAVLSVIMLGKRLGLSKWVSLILLTVGIALAQLPAIQLNTPRRQNKLASVTTHQPPRRQQRAR